MTGPRFLPILGDWARGEGPLYQRLADGIRAAIERGDLPAGARLPAQRVLARWLEVSRTTVVLAYEALAAEQWLEGRQGSGTTVRRSPARAVATRGGAEAVLSTRNVLFRGLVERTGADVEFLGAHLEGLPRSSTGPGRRRGPTSTGSCGGTGTSRSACPSCARRSRVTWSEPVCRRGGRRCS